MSTRSSVYYHDAPEKGFKMHIFWEYLEDCYQMEIESWNAGVHSEVLVRLPEDFVHRYIRAKETKCQTS